MIQFGPKIRGGGGGGPVGGGGGGGVRRSGDVLPQKKP